MFEAAEVWTAWVMLFLDVGLLPFLKNCPEIMGGRRKIKITRLNSLARAACEDVFLGR